MKPSIGCIVHIHVDPDFNNGSDVAPAMITRVWSDSLINVKVIKDAPDNTWKTSISLVADEQAARDLIAARHEAAGIDPDTGWSEIPGLDTVAFWPPRT